MTGFSGTDPSDTEQGSTVIVTDNTQQTVTLTTDTAVLYQAPAVPLSTLLNTGAQLFLEPLTGADSGLPNGDTVTVATAAVFGNTTDTIVPIGTGNTFELVDVSQGFTGVAIIVDGADGADFTVSQDSSGDYILTSTAPTGSTNNNPCYRRGTAIRTTSGDVPVEALKEGDIAILADGAAAPITWLGHRSVDCTRHPNPKSIWPILISAHAFADNVPSRDLYLSPGHSVFMNGVLMQAEKLINGATIRQIQTDSVEYWHVELPTHGILLAENLPAESYLDQGNRNAFLNGGAFVEAHPDFAPKHWAETCAPLVFEGPELQAAKTTLLARAKERGFALTQDSDIHILADGKRIDPVDLGESRQVFLLPEGATAITLQSRSFTPAHANPASTDKRSLGIRARRLQLDGEDIPMNHETAFAAGWHNHETRDGKPGTRWTTGATPLPANTRLVMLEHAGTGQYWAAPKPAEDNVIALFA